MGVGWGLSAAAGGTGRTGGAFAVPVLTLVRRGAVSLGRSVALGALSVRTRGAELVAGQFAVFIGVESGESLIGIREFLLGNDPVAIGIEGEQDGGWRRSLALATPLLTGVFRGVAVSARAAAFVVALRARRAEFLPAEFAIPVLVEPLQGPGRSPELEFREFAVAVVVEGFDEERHRRGAVMATGAARPTLLGAALGGGEGSGNCREQGGGNQESGRFHHSIGLVNAC